VADALALITANNLLLKGARIDLTEDKTYSIAEGTVNIVNTIESPTKLKFFYSEKDSSELGFLRDYARRIESLLEEYVLRSNGKLAYEVIDPEAFSVEEEEAAEHGIQRISMGFGGEPVFFGLVAVSDNGDEETIEFLHPDREEFLEYDISQMVAKVSRTQSQKIGMISGLPVSGGFDQMQGRAMPPWQTYSELRKLYEIEDLGVDVVDVPADIDLLLLIHPDNVTEKTLYAIDQYALRGGGILAFVDVFAQTDPLLASRAQAPGLAGKSGALLQNWGVELIGNKILADAAHALRVGGGATQRPTPHLGVFGYGQANWAVPDHPILSELNNVIFSSGSVIKATEGASTSFEPLIQSSNQAGLLDSTLLQNLRDPSQLANGFTPTGETYTVAAHVTGKVSSAYPDGRPVVEEADTDAAAGDDDKKTTEGATDMNSVISDINSGTGDAAEKPTPAVLEHVGESVSEGVNLFVVADTDVLNDPLWVRMSNFFGKPVAQPFADNGNFVVNTVENILGSTDLMSLRSRGTHARPFHVVEDLEREAAANFQAKEQELQSRLAETEARLAQLQQQREGQDGLTLSSEQQQEVENFRAQQLTIRKELREVQHQLGQDIEKLGGWIKLLNIMLVPALVTLGALIMRFRRKRVIREANKGIRQSHSAPLSQT